jgi:hypothetical protein
MMFSRGTCRHFQLFYAASKAENCLVFGFYHLSAGRVNVKAREIFTVFQGVMKVGVGKISPKRLFSNINERTFASALVKGPRWGGNAGAINLVKSYLK